MLFDTAPHMLYRYDNRTWLELAQSIGDELIRQLPDESQVAVLDGSRTGAAFSVDVGAAAAATRSLEVSYAPPSWDRQIAEAIRLLADRDQTRKELYLFSDLSRATWSALRDSKLAEQLAEHADIAVHLIDVGVTAPSNDAVTGLTLSQSTLTPGSPVQFRVQVGRTWATDKPSERGLQLVVEKDVNYQPVMANGKLTPPETEIRGRQTVPAAASTPAPVDGEAGLSLRHADEFATFTLTSLPVGTHHGYVTLDGTDNLSVDDRRYFTLQVRSPRTLLIATGDDAESFSVTECLAPREFRETGRAKFVCQLDQIARLGDKSLAEYSAIGLLDPPPLSAETWRTLQTYVERGGGLAIFLGRNARSAVAFNSAAAAELLPAPIERQYRDDDGVTLAPRDFAHPLLVPLRDLSSSIPWDGLPVFRHWVTGTLSAASRVIVPFSNGTPALLERRVGQGRVLLMTTPVSDVDESLRPAWNLLPQGDPAWPYLILLDRLFLYLVQGEEATLDYAVGQTAQIPVDVQTVDRIRLFTPRNSWIELTASQGSVQVPFTDTPGVYRMQLTENLEVPRGFSVNLSSEASDLVRVTDAELDASLGADRYRIAHDMQEIERDVDETRIGQEFYPFLLTLLAAVMAIEHLVSNRFYPSAPAVEPAA